MDKKVLRWNFVFQYGYVFTNILNSFILLPLYLKYIDTNTLGVWLATGAILGWMTLVDPGIGEVLQQRIAEWRGRKDYNEVGKMVASGFVASALVLVLAIIIGLGCYFSVGFIINKNIYAYPHLPAALLISVVSTCMMLISFSLSGINQGLHNSGNVAVASLSANFLFLLVNLSFLYLGMGVMSIALANLFRAVFINAYNLISMFQSLKKQAIKIIFDKAHLKSFTAIFSFTSASKIIGGLSFSVDMLVLARFIPPSMITVYEINKRPINVTSSLVGSHSVALMPSISHAKGSGDKQAIIELINKQFKIYIYAAFFCVVFFYFNYQNLITLWTGPGRFAGNFILLLLVINFIANLYTYYMNNVGYALGDIKKNSVFNIVRGVAYGVIMYFAARFYGIPGAILTSICMVVLADIYFYAKRLFRLGYLTPLLVFKDAPLRWLLIVSLGLTMGYFFRLVAVKLVTPDMLFTQLIVSGGLFTLFFITFILIADKQIRNLAKEITAKFVLFPLNKLKESDTVSFKKRA